MKENCLIVLNYNDYETTCEFINIIKNYKSIDYIVIVDNCSTDNSYEILKKLEVVNKIKLVKTNMNKGYAYGNNYGIKFAEKYFLPDYIIISNPDVYFEDNLVNNLIDILEDNNKIAICTSPMYQNENKRSKVIAYKLPRYIDYVKSCFPILNRFFNVLAYENDFFNNKEICYVDAVQGSFFIIKDEVIRKIDYLDEDTFLYCEEVILGYKLKTYGYYTSIYMNGKYIHKASTTINKNIKNNMFKYKILMNSRKVYLTKYLKVNKFKIIIFDLCVLIGKIERLIYHIVFNK